MRKYLFIGLIVAQSSLALANPNCPYTTTTLTGSQGVYIPRPPTRYYRARVEYHPCCDNGVFDNRRLDGPWQADGQQITRKILNGERFQPRTFAIEFGHSDSYRAKQAASELFYKLKMALGPAAGGLMLRTFEDTTY